MAKKSTSITASILPDSIGIPDEYKALLTCFESINNCFDNHLKKIQPHKLSIDLKNEQSNQFAKYLSNMPLHLTRKIVY
ncbi:MAG: hypothetical protein COA79_20890 [Planctomycetota bacterium]|nr:MAG: hypothetical protein COA79_20890 [Planctomycetota bacterium]